MMTYKGYIAKVVFDDEANVFHGEIINIRDVVTFQGSSVRELRDAFKESVDDYLRFCAERGEEPDRPYSGKFVVRLKPDQHRVVTMAARKAGKSLNTWVSDRLYQDAVRELGLKRAGHRDSRKLIISRQPVMVKAKSKETYTEYQD